MQAFRSWARTPIPPDPDAPPNPDVDPPFPISPELNRRIVLEHAAVPADLAVDALVINNNEMLTDRSGPTGEAFARAPGLVAETAKLDSGVRTGDSKLTGSGGLAARHAIHSIGPKYQPRYAVAAESSLHWCYRSSLQLCRDHGLRTVAFLPLHTEKKGYPASEGAHIALRTIRRCLERSPGSLDAVLLMVAKEEDRAAYLQAAPLYFPRNAAELARSTLNFYTEKGEERDGGVGDADGERRTAERQIRIANGPQSAGETGSGSGSLAGGGGGGSGMSGYTPLASFGATETAAGGGGSAAAGDVNGREEPHPEPLDRKSRDSMQEFGQVQPSPDERLS